MYTTQQFSLHTHTIGFDGRNSAAEMVRQAKDMGWHSLGISNHFIVHPAIKSSRMYKYAAAGGYANIYSESFDEAINKFLPHYNELRDLRDSTHFNLYIGMEVDFFNDPLWRRGFDRAIKILKPDYVIGSAHFVWHDNNLCNSHDIKNMDQSTRNLVLEKYWKNVQGAAQRGLFNWLAHLDLMKKVGLGREDMWQDIERETVSIIASSGSAIEINTGLYKPNLYEPYPSERILNMVSRTNIPVLLSDDAHSVNQLGRHFDEASELLEIYFIKNILTAHGAVNRR
ncbi:MAG: histidinol-phosphatase HisJ family protein [Proteobacteria bacterium]|nr:histidinol-phosphatase HisJ family protein [Candidatus Enterousia scatequi]